MFVVDASVTMAWCSEDEASDPSDAVLDRLRQESAVVPPLWRLEVVNVLLVAERRRRVTEAEAIRFLTLLDQLPIVVDSSPPRPEQVLAVGRRHALSSYDTSYLLLAQQHGVPLATTDDTLTAACLAAGVATLIPTD